MEERRHSRLAFHRPRSKRCRATRLHRSCNEDEGEYGDYQDAWLARGDLERQPVGIFTDGDPDNIIDLDDDEHFESGAEYDRDALIKNLTELSKHIDRNSSEFEAIGDYEIYVWLDPEYYKS